MVFECSSNKMLPSISTFTTRLETLPGVTFLSIAPDSQYTEKIIENAKNKKEIEDYIFECSKKTNDQTKEKEKYIFLKKKCLVVVCDYVSISIQDTERDRGAAELFSFLYGVPIILSLIHRVVLKHDMCPFEVTSTIGKEKSSAGTYTHHSPSTGQNII